MTDGPAGATGMSARRANGVALLLALPAYLLISAAWPLISPELIAAAFADAQASFSNLMLLFGCAAGAVVAAGALPARKRRMLLGTSLTAAALVLAIAPLLVQAGVAKPQPLALIALILIDGARALVPVLAVAIAFDGFRQDGATKPIAAVGAAAAAASLSWSVANFIALKLNPDLGALHAAGQIIALAGAAIAAVLVAQLAGPLAGPPGDNAKPQGWSAAFADLWRTPAVRLAMAGRLLAVCAVGGLRVLGYELSVLKGSTGTDVFTRGAGLAAAFALAGTLAGAAWADARRRQDKGADALVCAIAIAAAVPVYLFGVFSASPTQLAVSFGLAAGLCLFAWAPTFMIVQDGAKPATNPVAVGVLVWIGTQFELFGPPHLVQALVLKLTGAENWSFATGFWGELKYGAFTTHFFLPFKLRASLGASPGAVLQSSAVLTCLLLAGAAGLYFLSARARRAEAKAEQPVKPDTTGPILARVLTTFVIAAVVVLGAVCIQALGAFERQWSVKVVWKSPDAAWAAVRQCKTTDCLTDLMARNDADPEAIAFTRLMYERLGGDYVGYATDFRGQGRVKAVETLLPNLSTAGYIGLVFLDGTRPLVNQYESTALDRIAGTNDVFQRIHANYPMATTWPEHSFAREEPRNGGQSFVMDLRIVNGCKTCSVLGSVQVAYDFDGRGHFEGVRLLEVKSAPAPAPFPAPALSPPFTTTTPPVTPPPLLPPPSASFTPNRS